MRSKTNALVGSLGALILIAPFFFAQTSNGGAGKNESRPTSVGQEEVRDHRVGEPPFLRISLPPREAAELGMEGIAVHLIVDTNGAVTSASPDNGVSADLQSRAEAAVRNVRYRPFERGGHPVAATFEERVMVLPPELIPKTRIPFPTVHDWNSVRITLKRTGCFGTCPSYRVQIHGDGTVLYEGQGFVAVKGSHRGSIPKESIVELVNAFHDADYYSLRDEYVWGATDLPTYETSIEIDGRVKTVKDYAGGQIGMPLTVSKLEADIDRLADTDRWTKGNENTTRSLTEEKWNLKTPEAGETLARVAQSGNAEAVRDLVTAGVPLDANSKSASMTLSQAARRGDMTMLRALLEAGAGKNTDAINMALVMAASNGRVEAVRSLIGYGASPNSADRSGRTLLMAAASSGVPAVVEQALSFNPDVNGRGAQGRTALMEAVGRWHYGAERAEVSRAEVVRLLLEHGADPNLQDETRSTALIECAWDADAALMLIKHGASVNAQNNDGISPLTNTPTADVARVLIENGADLSLRDKQGKTALEEAKQSGMKEKATAIEAAQEHKQ